MKFFKPTKIIKTDITLKSGATKSFNVRFMEIKMKENALTEMEWMSDHGKIMFIDMSDISMIQTISQKTRLRWR